LTAARKSRKSQQPPRPLGQRAFQVTIITFGLTIQDILNDPDITIGIFSFTRPAAKENYLRRIKWNLR